MEKVLKNGRYLSPIFFDLLQNKAVYLKQGTTPEMITSLTTKKGNRFTA